MKWNELSRSGVTADMSPVFAKRIILTNLLGLLYTVNMSVSGFAFLFFKQYFLALFTFIFVATEFSWIIFNRLRKYTVSRVGILVSSNLLGFAVSVCLPGTGYNRGFYVMAGIPVLLFGLKEKKFIILGLLLPLILYPLSEWLQYRTDMFGIVPEFSQSIRMFISYSIGLIYVVLIFLMFLFLSIENERAIEQLEDQRARSFSASKFAALGEMASGIGHEINNPMTVISLNNDLVKHLLEEKEINRPMIVQRLDIIANAVKRVSHIIDSMRLFSREGKTDQFQRECAKKIVEQTLTFCHEKFRNHNINLSINYHSDEFFFNCRPVQISQVLLNLLNNSFDAIEFMEEKWIRLEITKRENGKLSVIVTDSGNGIPEEHKEKIFEPFFTTKPVGRGTGLGLSLSRKMIEDHGGRIYVDSSSKNTSFVIEV